MIESLQKIFPQHEGDARANSRAVVEDLLNKDGTTVNIREDCGKRMASLNEKECVILVSGTLLTITSIIEKLISSKPPF